MGLGGFFFAGIYALKIVDAIGENLTGKTLFVFWDRFTLSFLLGLFVN
jgi:hypothetical protein